MTDLSPAAQAVLDAYQFAPIEDELTIAAVVRAVADQVVPEGWRIHQAVRYELLAIAAELEQFHD